MPSAKSYLSIDLDYWHEDNFDNGIVLFFDQVFMMNLPILVVESHENLLKAVNKSEARVLYNVDFHSDFIGNYLSGQLCKIVDANWVNHVKWRESGEYVWIYPRKECFHDDSFGKHSLQEGRGACWGIRDNNPFEIGNHDWKLSRHQSGTDDVCWEIDWGTVCGIGVSLSQDYLLGNYRLFDVVVERLTVRRRFYKTLAERHCFDSKWSKIVVPVT